jgi:hypothetical protein
MGLPLNGSGVDVPIGRGVLSGIVSVQNIPPTLLELNL